MILGIRRKYKLLLLVTVAVIFIRMSDAFILKEISIFPEGIIGGSDLLAAPLGKNIFNFSGSKFIDSIITNEKVIKADLNFGLPDELKIVLMEVSLCSMSAGI